MPYLRRAISFTAVFAAALGSSLLPAAAAQAAGVTTVHRLEPSAVAPALGAPAATRYRGRLLPGGRLNPGDRLVSPNRLNVLVMQQDGNLVETIPRGRIVWQSGTHDPYSVLFMQNDGNLVVVAPGNRPVWASGTAGRPGSDLELQNDRNLVVYAPGHVAVWANNIAGRP
ncbi:hypothetical protein [Streptomyces humi]|uniref:hypothetical protein n=1 Tax=Streptomyces humi TaxID=1428620 RepID=UPI00069A3204|nr:hypothetical protein [Streptomyces humi]